MSNRKNYRTVATFALIACAIPCLLFAVSILSNGERNLGTIESISGIPFPVQDGTTVVLEEMAHADLFLQESVFAKQAILSVSFDPQDTETIDVGVRENEFWLSYIKYPLYRKGVDARGYQTKEISIPLTSALQDTNRSVDLMFFASGNEAPEWRIQAFHATVEPIMPHAQEVKNYIKSLILRERPI